MRKRERKGKKVAEDQRFNVTLAIKGSATTADGKPFAGINKEIQYYDMSYASLVEVEEVLASILNSLVALGKAKVAAKKK